MLQHQDERLATTYIHARHSRPYRIRLGLAVELGPPVVHHPLPHVTHHVVQSKFVGREGSHGARACVSVLGCVVERKGALQHRMRVNEHELKRMGDITQQMQRTCQMFIMCLPKGVNELPCGNSLKVTRSFVQCHAFR